MNHFFSGLSYNIKGIKYFFEHKQLWKYAIIPLIINFLALILLVSFYLHSFNGIFNYITGPLAGIDITDPSGFLWRVADLGLWFLQGILKIIFFILSMLIIFVSVFLFSGLVNAPFYEMMAENILIQENIFKDSPFDIKIFCTGLIYSLKIELYKIVFFVSVSLLLFLVGLIPLVGPFFLLLSFFFTAWVFAFGVCTYPMVLKKQSFRQILVWALKNKMLLIGFGLPAIVPFIGLIIICFQVSGGTLIYINNSDSFLK